MMPFHPEFPRRILNVQEPGIHRIMSEARLLREQGRDIIVLAQAVPDITTPPEVLEAISACLYDRATGLYTPDPGLPELREAIASHLRSNRSIPASFDGTVVTPGANAAYAALIPAICEPGDEVILPTPYYLNHEMAIRMADCIPVEVKADEEAGFALDPQAIADAVTDRTRAITLVSPNNPTGAVYKRKAVNEVIDIAHERNLWIISDEVYDNFTFPGHSHFSPASVAPERTVTIGSFSKSHAMTGWRVGWLSAPESLVPQYMKVHDTFFICASTASQRGALRALEMGTSFLASYRAELEQRVASLRKGITAIPRLQWREPGGALFALVRVEDADDPSQLATDILHRTGVALVPGTAFGRGGASHLRISFGAATVPVIAEACNRLAEYFEQ